MDVIIAHNIGFCDGVKRAMHIALEAADKHGGLIADGPLVHNRQALELLVLRGVDERRPEGLDTQRPLLIRAHGVEPGQREEWEAQGRVLVDATCPHVAANQALAREAAARGKTVLLAGDADHAEVKAVAGCGGSACRVVSSVADIAALPPPSPEGYFLLAQTTFAIDLFGEIVAALEKRFPGTEIADTVCRATYLRQAEAERLARRADVLVVVGGKNSANTRRLADAARRVGKLAYLVETAADIRDSDFLGCSRAAVISGASTPGWVTQEVVDRLRRLGRPTPKSFFFGLLQTLVNYRVSTAIAAAGLALAAQEQLLGETFPAAALAGALFVFFAHTLNRRIPADPRIRRLSTIDNSYRKRRFGLLTLAWLAALTSLILAGRQGTLVFILYLLALVGAAFYALPSYVKAKDDKKLRPRNWIMATAWALTLAGPAALSAPVPASAVIAMAFVFLICFGGTLIRDLLDIASDRLMGINTFPARHGPINARKAATWSFAAALFLPVLAVFGVGWEWQFSARLFFLLLLPAVPALGLYLLDLLNKRRLTDAVLVQAGVDGMGWLAGLLAIAFSPAWQLG